jgi:ssRNA-specific RNase YbeY (16S rRNA maturation enzyme)
MINIVSSSRYKVERKKIRQYLESVLIENGFSSDYIVNLVFIGRNKMRQISSKYKNEDVALPVLAFPYKGEIIEGEKVVGEIIICYPQAVLLAAERNKRVNEIINQLSKHGFNNLLK